MLTASLCDAYCGLMLIASRSGRTMISPIRQPLLLESLERKPMKTIRTILCASILLIVSVPCVLEAQTAKAPQGGTESCRKFVQEFYNWYLKMLNSRSNLSSTDLILKYRKGSFDPELVRQLKQDEDAASKNKEEVVGLDFDPIINAQDVAYSYKVGKVTRKGGNYWVEVYGDWGKVDGVPEKKTKEPDVVPELAFRNGEWVFVDFHYPGAKNPQDESLLKMLKYLREERRKGRK